MKPNSEPHEPPLTPELIHWGYTQACFPMADDETDEINWYRADPRALFPIAGIRVSRSLAKRIRSGRFLVTFDRCFEDVVRACQRPDGNWINDEIIAAYSAAHQEGWAHSCEVWAEGELVGGTYGVALGTLFAAESMFHRVSDASKIALWAMVNRCRDLGFTVFDAEVMNPHLASLGAFDVPLVEYLVILEEALLGTTAWSPGRI